MENVTSIAQSKNEDTLEGTIVALYKKLLQVDDIDGNSNFYQHGGTSLSATLLLAELVSQHGVTITFDEFDQNNTPAALSTKLSARHGGERAPSFERRASYERIEFELSAPQRSRSWYLAGFAGERAGDEGMYNSGYATWLTGRIDLESLERALNLAARQHDSLGASHGSRGGRTVQTFRAHRPIDFRIEVAPTSIREAYAARKSDDLYFGDIDEVKAFIHAPFDWAAGETLRCRVYTLGEAEYLFLLAGNHIAFDLMSRGIFLRDVAAIYNGLIDGQSRSPKRPAQYRDYLEWERRYLDSRVYTENLGYWIKYLSGSEQEVRLPVAVPRATARLEDEPYHQDKKYLTLEGALIERVKAAAQAHGVTPYVMLFTAFAITLARLSSQKRLTIGTQIANRRHQETLEICGCFAQPVALVCDLRDLQSPNSVEMALRAVQKDLNAAIEHQPIALPAIADALQREGHERLHPLYQCSFEYFDAKPQPLALFGAEAQEILIPYHFGRTSSEVMFLLWDRPQGIAGVILYARELYTSAMVDALANDYVATLKELLEVGR